MGYAFARSDASIEAAVRRIATEQISSALERFEKSPDAPKTIHSARKTSKRLRGLVRLVRPSFRDYRTENAAIRDAAALLSSTRDAEVALETFDLLTRTAEEAKSGAFARMRDALQARRDAASANDSADAGRRFCDELAELRERVAGWRIGDDGFSAVSDGLEKTFARARAAMRHARKHPEAEVFHDWRKAVKYHWYHARLLAPAWPDVIDGHARAAGRLGDALGAHHDLVGFIALIDNGIGADATQIAPLLSLAKARRDALEAECFSLGARLLAEDQKALSRRWRACWKAWRAETLMAA